MTRIFLKLLSAFLPESFLRAIFKKGIENALEDWGTDKFLEVLLRMLDLFISISRGFRKNLKGFNAKYLFSTSDGSVHTSAIFANKDLKVIDSPIKDWDTKIKF